MMLESKWPTTIFTVADLGIDWFIELPRARSLPGAPSIAIDAQTGQEIWRTMTLDPAKPFTITGIPKVFKGKVIIGNGGTEMTAARGSVTAYDAETGVQALQFYVVPGNPADGFESDAVALAATTWLFSAKKKKTVRKLLVAIPFPWISKMNRLNQR